MANTKNSGSVPEAKNAMNKFKMEVAKEIAISQAQVSRLEKKILLRLRQEVR